MTDPEADKKEAARRDRIFALEVCFLGFVGVLVVWAFLEALTYQIVSSRTPFVIMVPLLILIAIQARRLWRARGEYDAAARIVEAFSGMNPVFNKVAGFCGWMVALVVVITVFGHYAGLFGFCVVLMRFLAGERWVLTILVAAGTTLFIFAVFELIFNIDLYRGLVLRWVQGYRDF